MRISIKMGSIVFALHAHLKFSPVQDQDENCDDFNIFFYLFLKLIKVSILVTHQNFLFIISFFYHQHWPPYTLYRLASKKTSSSYPLTALLLVIYSFQSIFSFNSSVKLSCGRSPATSGQERQK